MVIINNKLTFFFLLFPFLALKGLLDAGYRLRFLLCLVTNKKQLVHLLLTRYLKFNSLMPQFSSRLLSEVCLAIICRSVLLALSG